MGATLVSWSRITCLLSVLLITACARHSVSGSSQARAPTLSAVNVSDGEDFARVVLVWMGRIDFTETFEPATDELPGRLHIRARPAALLDSKAIHGFDRNLGGRFSYEPERGPLERIEVEEDSRDRAVEITLIGHELERYRLSVFEAPHRLVIDTFAEADAPAKDFGTDALGELVGAMSDASTLEREDNDDFLVVIDPGHGGFEPGASGPSGVREKNVNLAISLRVADVLSGVRGVEVVLTRSTDVFLPLKERTRIANDLDADLFVSIHANASVNGEARGLETYYLNTATDRAAARLAKRENTVAGGLSDYDDDDKLMGVLRDLSLGGQVEHSRSLALNIQREMVSSLRLNYAPKSIRDLGVKTALFYVLVGSNMTSILVETSFVSHPQEEQRLIDPFYQQELANAIVRGILTYAQDSHRLPQPESAYP